MSLAILVSATAHASQGAAGRHRRVLGRLRLEVVVGLAKGEAGDCGEAGDHPAGELGMGVDAGAHGRAAQGQFAQPVEAACQPPPPQGHLAGVAAEFLAEADRRGILQMGAADLDDVVECLGLLAQGLLHAVPGPASAVRWISTAAARWMAVGMTSLLDWPRLT